MSQWTSSFSLIGPTGSTGPAGPAGSFGLTGTTRGDYVYYGGTTWTVGSTIISIGSGAGQTSQGAAAIAIGRDAGNASQSASGVAIGDSAGRTSQGIAALAFGGGAGYQGQGNFATAVGNGAGYLNQQASSLAVGNNAGYDTQGTYAVAVGNQAGESNQGAYSVAVGYGAGSNAQGSNAVAIGFQAGNASQPAGSIILNAGATGLNGDNAGLYIKPIRQVVANGQFGVYYDATTHEVIHNSVITISSISSIVVGANIIPDRSLAYSLGTSSLRFADAFFGPGTINIAGPSNANATIGTDAQGIIYTQSGFATPFVNIGPAQLTPQAVGGWQIGPTGTQGTPGFDLIVQEQQANGSGPTGPIYSLINQPTGPTGNTGPTGPQGENGISGGLTFYLDSATRTVTAGNPAIGSLPLTPNLGAQTTITYVTTGAQNVLVAKFTTDVGALSSRVVSPGLWDLNIFAAVSNTGGGPSFYYSIFQVDADGASNPILIVSGSNEPMLITNLQASQLIYDLPLYVPYYLLTDSTKRIQVQLFVNGGGTNRTAYFEFRSGAVSHLHTTLAVTTGATGPAGPTGPTGMTGPASSGYIVQAIKQTNQTIPQNSDTVVQFTDDLDPNNWWNSSSNTFNPTISGYYLCTATIRFAAGTITTDQTNLQIRKNGAGAGIVQHPITIDIGNSLVLTKIVQMNGTTDYLDVTAYSANPSGQLIEPAGSWFCAALQ